MGNHDCRLLTHTYSIHPGIGYAYSRLSYKLQFNSPDISLQ